MFFDKTENEKETIIFGDKSELAIQKVFRFRSSVFFALRKKNSNTLKKKKKII